MCMGALSPLDDTVSAQNPELEYQEPFCTGKVMWKKIAPAPAQTIPVSCDFYTIQSGLLNLGVSVPLYKHREAKGSKAICSLGQICLPRGKIQ